MKPLVIIGTLGTMVFGAIAPSIAVAITVSVPNVDSGAENLRLTSLGATTASNVGFGNHVVGPAEANAWVRPIIQFPVSGFSSLSGLTVVSATLHYSIISDFMEPGEFAASEVRLFTTSETDLSTTNRDVFAGLSGDGGGHIVVGSASFVGGATGGQTLAFSAAAVTALEAAINGAAPTLAISFREFAVSNPVDSLSPLDEVVLGVPPGNMSIEITATPEPATLFLLVLAGPWLVRHRRNRSSIMPRIAGRMGGAG